MPGCQLRSIPSVSHASCSKKSTPRADGAAHMEIGFIGLGNMGFHMARRLVEAGHQLVVNDTRPQAVARLTDMGAQAAASPAELADQVETVIASLPTPDIVHAVATGPGGVI